MLGSGRLSSGDRGAGPGGFLALKAHRVALVLGDVSSFPEKLGRSSQMTPHTSFDSKRRSAADAAHLRGPRVSRRAGRVQHREREQGEPGRPARGSVSSACLLAAGGRTEEASEHTCGLSGSPLGRLRQHTSAQFCPLTLCLVRAQPPHLGAPGDRDKWGL